MTYLWRALWLAVTLMLACAPSSQAHTRSQSSSHWRVEGDALIGRVQADALDVTRLYALGGDASLEETFRAHAGESFAASTQAGPCLPREAPRVAPAAAGRVAALLRFDCPPGALDHGAVDLKSTLFLSVAATHLHFVSVTRVDGAEAEDILTDSRRSATFQLQADARTQSAWSAFSRYLPIGAVHVWGGLDHLAFILGLTLLARSLTAIAIAATGFTLGHTATLGLAAFGVLAPDSATVEALIGFTVAFVALEAGGGGQERLTRWSAPLAVVLIAMAALAAAHVLAVAALSLAGLAVFAFAYPRGFPRGAAAAPWLAAAFGLVHGCGFAGALSELDLPRPKLLSALAGFNVGVELAQICVIAGALGAAFVWRRVTAGRYAIAQDVVTATIFALGLFWFASRSIGA